MATNFVTPFKGRDLEIFAKIFGKIFFTFIGVSRCPESNNRNKMLALFRGRDLDFLREVINCARAVKAAQYHECLGQTVKEVCSYK